MSTAENKLTKARTRLILDHPFLGALTLRLPMIEANPDWCPTTATDAKSFYYHSDYINDLSTSQIEFVLAHEALHCALSHFARRQHRIKRRWDIACDYAINPLLVKEGFAPPPGIFIETRYEGMTAEEIYPYIDDNNVDGEMDKHVYDMEDQSKQDPQEAPPNPSDSEASQSTSSSPSPTKGTNTTPSPTDSKQTQAQPSRPDSLNPVLNQQSKQTDSGTQATKRAEQPPPLSPDEQEQLQIQWQQRLAGAAQQAIQAGKMGKNLARVVDDLLQPQLPWRMLLADYMTALARDDYSYMRPSRREGNAILPSLRSHQTALTIALDTSGSISNDEMDEFISEINAIKAQIRATITLLACDTELSKNAPWIYQPWEEFRYPEKISGGGGTDFRPIFDWLEQQDQAPDLLIYFTDANGLFPKQAPYYPVLWLVKGKSNIPWGKRVQLN